MAKQDRFFIGPPKSGLQRNVRPWLIADDAFATINNAYVFRGRVRKRFGANLLFDSTSLPVEGFEQLNSRLRVNVGTTAAVSGDLGSTVMPGARGAIGQMFSIGSTVFTVNALGTPATLLTTGTATGTYDTTTRALIITGNTENPLTDVFFYPAEPVMGFVIYEDDDINDDDTYAFDRQFAYEYVGGGWDRLTTGSDTWTGSDSDFFWGTTWRGANNFDNLLFVTNYTAADGIRHWNGATWTLLNPAINTGGDTLETARIILPFKDRLVVLNTIENDGVDRTYVNRCRFSQNGSPLTATAWRQDIAGLGGFIDAPTKEAIVTASILKDRLIVYFERSTWELVYTNNQVLPFVWQKINSELGVESTFSFINFDTAVLGIGNVGVHTCNGAYVERIDEKIPDEIFQIHNENEGPFRVHGIRDFEPEMAYWTFPDQTGEPTFPTRVLVYNYTNGTWAFNNDSITAFGYFQNPSDLTWATWTKTWSESSDPWNSGSQQSRFRNVIAGNQEGWTFNIDYQTTTNSPALQITDIVAATGVITVINHNLVVGDIIFIENVLGTTGLNGINFEINSVTDANNFVIVGTFAGTYTGAGTIRRVSKVDILTKQYNFYNQQSFNVQIQRVEFYVDSTESGELLVDYFTNSAQLGLVSDGIGTGAAMGTNILETFPDPNEPYEGFSTQLWKSVYFQGDGDLVQFRIHHTTDQMLADPDLASNDFQLHAFIVYAQKSRNR